MPDTKENVVIVAVAELRHLDRFGRTLRGLIPRLIPVRGVSTLWSSGTPPIPLMPRSPSARSQRRH